MYSDSLRAGRSGDRIPVEAKLSVLLQTGTGAPPSLPYDGYWVSFPRIKAAGAWLWSPTPV